MNFRRYETLILLSPSLVGDQVEAFKSKVDSILTTGGGQVIRIEEWGRKRLAYPVRKEIFGYYLLYDFRARPTLANELERNFKIDEQVYKYLTLVLDSNFTEERLKAVQEALANEASRRDKEQAQINEAKNADAEKNSQTGNGFDDDYPDESDSESDLDVPSDLEPQDAEPDSGSEITN
jgi:small subunit ribosomal protein S6